MSRGYGYSYATRESLIALRGELDKAPWASIEHTSFARPDHRFSEEIAGAPALVLAKLRLVYSLDELIALLGTSAALPAIDRDWDSLQRRLKLRCELSLEEGTPEEREAARGLSALLLNNGLEHTKYSFEEEVTFGRAQVQLARSEQAAARVALLQLGGLIEQIEKKTEDLAAAQPQGDGQNTTPSRQQSIATAACVSALNAAHELLDALGERSLAGESRERFASLRKTLETVLQQSEPPAVKPKPVPQS